MSHLSKIINNYISAIFFLRLTGFRPKYPNLSLLSDKTSFSYNLINYTLFSKNKNIKILLMDPHSYHLSHFFCLSFWSFLEYCRHKLWKKRVTTCCTDVMYVVTVSSSQMSMMYRKTKREKSSYIRSKTSHRTKGCDLVLYAYFISWSNKEQTYIQSMNNIHWCYLDVMFLSPSYPLT